MSFILHTIWEVLKGVPNTVIISIVAMIIGLVIGTIFAMIRLAKIPVLSQLIVVYSKHAVNRAIIRLVLWFTSSINLF